MSGRGMYPRPKPYPATGGQPVQPAALRGSGGSSGSGELKTGPRPQEERIMSFKVKDLSVSLSIEEGSTCTTLTKPTGGETFAGGGWFLQEGARRNLAALKTQLRHAMTRA